MLLSKEQASANKKRRLEEQKKYSEEVKAAQSAFNASERQTRQEVQANKLTPSPLQQSFDMGLTPSQALQKQQTGTYMPATPYQEAQQQQNYSKPQWFDAPLSSLVSTVNEGAGQKLYAVGNAFQNSLGLGIKNFLSSKLNPEEYRQKQEVAQQNPVASAIGGTAGYIMPGAAAEKLAVGALPSIFGKGLGKATSLAASGIGAGAITGAVEGATSGDVSDIPKEIYNQALMGGVGGGVLGGASKGVERLATNKALRNIDEAYNILKQEGVTNIPSVGTPKPLSLGGTQFLNRYDKASDISKTIREGLTPNKTLALPAPKPNVIDVPPGGFKPPKPLQLGEGTKPVALLPEGKFQMPPAKPVKLGEAPSGKFNIKRKIKEPQKIINIDGEDFYPIKGATTAPKGYTWYNNGKSRFNNEYKQILLPQKNIFKNISDFTPAKKTIEPIGKYAQQMRQIKGEAPKTPTRETPFKVYPGEVSKANTPPKVLPQYAKDKFDIPKQPNKVRQNKPLKPTKVESNIQTPKAKNEPFKSQINAMGKEEYSKPLIETPTGNVRSQRQIPDTSKMSDAEFDAYYGLDQKPSAKSVRTMVEDIGAKVINEKGTDDIPSLINIYKKKYGVDKDIKVSYSLKKDTSLGGTQPIRDANGNIKGYKIALNPNQSIEGRIGSLRHEIEHIIDLESGYVTPSAKYKFNPKTDTTGRILYENASKGHHKNRAWFERDYLRQLTKEELGGTAGSVEAKLSKTEKPQGKFKVFDTTEDVAKEMERGYSKNIKSDLNMNDDIRKSFADNPETYDVLANKKTLAKAEAEFNKGYEVALARFDAKKSYSPEDVPLSRMLANEAANRGDYSTARRILSTMAEKLTEAGQLSQAARILRRSDPSVLVDFLQKRVAKLNKEGEKLYGRKWKELKLTDAQTKEIYKLDIYDEAAFEKQLNKVHDEWAQDIPATKMEKFNSWRRMAMLLNPKTHIRNIVGNSIMVTARKTADTIGAGLEKMFVKKELRTKSFNWSKDKELVDIVDADWNKNKDLLAMGGRWDMDTAIFGKEKKIFNNKTLEWINKLSRETLNWEDIVFMKRAYKDALGQFMNARGMKQVTNEAREYAQRRAYEATYRQVNKFSQWVTNIKKNGGFAGTILEAKLPFVKTPANIAVNAAQYSPLGFTKLLFAKNRQSATDVIETLSKGITGTGLFSLGIGLAALGWAKVSRKTSGALENITQDLGEQPFSINTPKGSYTFDWAQPPSIPLAMGISVYESLMKKKANPEDSGFGESVMDAMIAGGDTFMGSTMLRNIKDMFGGRYGSFTEALLATPAEYIEQSVPSILGQVTRTIDPVKRETGGNVLKSIQSRIPFASKALPAKVDVYGREQKQPEWWQQFISPGTYRENSNDPTSKELVRLNKSLEKTDLLPQFAQKQITYQLEKGAESQKLILKPDKKEAYAKALGSAYKTKLDEIISSSEYKSLGTDKEKASKINSELNKVKDKIDNDFLKKQGINEYKTPQKRKRPTLPKRASK